MKFTTLSIFNNYSHYLIARKEELFKKEWEVCWKCTSHVNQRFKGHMHMHYKIIARKRVVEEEVGGMLEIQVLPV